MNDRHWTTALCMGVSALAILAQAAPAMAQAQAQDRTREDTQAFDIPAQSAENALDAFVRQSRFQLVYTPETVRGVRTNPVRGTMTPRAALDRMLVGTGLQVVSTPGGGSAIRPIQAAVTEGSGTAVEVDDVVVTGTRLNVEYAGAAPVQIVDQEKAALSGLNDTSSVLRNQPQVSGKKSTLQFADGAAGFGQLPDGGIGAQTIALRGFSPSQTLVLVNGRRIAAAGTDGVPQAPDVGLIPFAIVDSYEILTDGASPVYGSDAIAGVINVRLRRNFDSSSFYVNATEPLRSGARDVTVSGVTGRTYDNGFFGLAAEYRRSEGLKYKDADYFGLSCEARYDRTSTGQTREIDLFGAEIPGTSKSPCVSNRGNYFSGRLQTAAGYTLFATPGRTNVGTAGFSVYETPATSADSATVLNASLEPVGSVDRLGVVTFQSRFDLNFDGVVDDGDQRAYFDPDGDGSVGFDVKDPIYNTSRGAVGDNIDFIAPVEQLSLFGYGEREFDILGNATLSFEASYNRREAEFRSAGTILDLILIRDFIVPVSNPTNPCGIEAGGCLAFFPGLDEFGDPDPNADRFEVAPQEVTPTLRVEGNADSFRSEIDLYRGSVGLTGDAAILSKFGLAGWRYGLSATYSRSEGVSYQTGVLREPLVTSLQTTVRDPVSGELVCGADEDQDGIPDQPQSCVVVDLFKEQTLLRGQLTAAERNFLLGEYQYRTRVELAQFVGTLEGNAFKLPAGDVSWVFGAEARFDKVEASGNDNVVNQRFATIQVADPGASGSRWVYDLFGEVGVPLLRDLPLVKRWNLSLAGRLTEDEYSGRKSVYSVSSRYEVFDWLALRATAGRSFRSPNSAELFRKPFLESVGYVGFVDPCAVPTAAIDVDGNYNPLSDPRQSFVLDNCRSAGLDPTQLGLDGQGYDTQLLRGGSADDLEGELANSLSAGVVVSLDEAVFGNRGFADGLSLKASGTYYEIEVENEIVPGNIFDILDGCYGLVTGRRYCARIDRDETGRITSLTTGSINGATRSTKGVDFNVLARKDFLLGARPFSLVVDLAGNYEFEVKEGDTRGGLDLSGSFLYPKLKGNITTQLVSNDWVGTWFTSYVDSGGPVSDGGFPAGTPTCYADEALDCREISRLEDYWLHNVSLTYNTAAWALTVGVNNLFDSEPPRIAPSVGSTGRSNTILNGNYDVFGRTVVIQLRKAF